MRVVLAECAETSLGWPGVGCRLRSVNAAEVVASLGGRAPAVGSDGVSSVATKLPVEVALARDTNDVGLRRAWRDRERGTGRPVLVVADDASRPGYVRVLGPVNVSDAVRTVPAGWLGDQLLGLDGMSRLAATRRLADELGRLDEAGAPGVVVKDLLTRHLLVERLPASEHWPAFAAATQPIPPGSDWRAALSALGYTLERRRHRGWLARAAGAPVLVVHPLADPAEFARLGADGRPPEGALLLDCAADGVGFGLLASGSRLRLFRAARDPGSSAATTSYLELDSSALRPENRPLLGLLAPDTLRPGGRFERLLEEARRFGARLRDRLDVQLRLHVLPNLAAGLGAHLRRAGGDLTDPAVRTEIEQACLTWAFRALFVLYAESAGYLPLDNAGYTANSATALTAEAAAADRLDDVATTLWDRFGVLVGALRTGSTSMRVPAYNGDLFAPDALPGATLLEWARVSDAQFGPALAALGQDPETGSGVDYSSLEIGHLGHLYEGLLALRLSIADADLGLYRTGSGAEERFEPARRPADAIVQAGQLFWQTNTGGRKAGGVYYTPTLLVDHLVMRAVLPALDEHLGRVRAIAEIDPTSAADELFRFRVLDPACGSAHFLVAALDRIVERVDAFLAETPLPAVREELESLRAAVSIAQSGRVEHADLLHRLVLKRCIFGVDLSPMGAEVARLSLWLASFVPGLSLAYLGHNVQVGDALVGVADPRVVAGGAGQAVVWDPQLEEAIRDGATAAAELAALSDRTPEEVAASHAADARIRQATEPVRRIFHAWTVAPLGVPAARKQLQMDPTVLLDGTAPVLVEVDEVVRRFRPLHWPLAFPEVFAGDAPGFDAVIGNPPWEEVTIEELAFYARHFPRLRGLAAGPREAVLNAARAARPELAAELIAEQDRVRLLRGFLGAAGGYASGPGDPDTYKFFCQRYRTLLRRGGRLGVVLPRSVFLAAGSRRFREWLFGSSRVERIDFLLNNRLWMFATHPQYTVALLVASAVAASADPVFEVAGVAASAEAFAAQSAAPGIRLHRDALGLGDVVPLLPGQTAEPVLRVMRQHRAFPFGGGRWRCFPVAEFHETNDKSLWEDETEGWALWKGGSFDQHDPHGADARWCPPSDAAMRKARKPRPGGESLLTTETTVALRAAAVAAEIGRVRLAFRDVSRSTDSRTVRASLIPAQTFLNNTAPYLAFVDGGHRERAACCAVMNSLPFDWQARRFVETHLNFYVLELLAVPAFDDATFEELVTLGARLSCPDERFAEVAEACGVMPRVLDPDERIALRARVDALVARAYGLGPADLDVLLADFTLDAVPPGHRAALRAELETLCR